MALSASNPLALIGKVAAVGVLGAAGFMFVSQERLLGTEAFEADTASAAAAIVGTDTDTGTDTGADAVPDAAPEAVAELGQSIVMAPTIDTFFRSPDDTTVIAGQAEPGQVVDIVLAGAVIDTVTAGPDGAFGTVVFIAASDQPRRLRLVADPQGAAIASAESIIVPPSEVTGVAVAAAPDVATAPGLGALGDDGSAAAPTISTTPGDQIAIASGVADVTAPQIGGSVDVGVVANTTAPTISAPPTLIADADGVRLLRPDIGAQAQPDLADNIALDTITYDPDGEVLLAGRGAASGGFVQIYLDNKPITTSKITIDGDWRTDLPNVDTGVYTLRVDEVDAEGVVQSRIETPFKKEEPAQVAAILAEETSVDGFDIAVKTVQPGATLWAIAEEQLGDGILYVSVFEANKDLIRDPDLIFPGQVFRIPEAE